jgi:hypothetical protein
MVPDSASESLHPASGTSRIDARWLALRVPADNSARAVTTRTLLPRLVEHLAVSGAEHGLEVIDLGSGTGANQRWLAPRLPFVQRWLCVDQDPTLQRDPAPPHTQLLVADVGVLESILAEPGGARLVTCSALLDLLTRAELEALGAALVRARTPALFSLTVTGAMALSPPDPLDSSLLEAFNQHQRRGARAGPDAGQALTQLVEAHLCVRTAETPWLLDQRDDAEFVRRFLLDRVAEAADQDPTLDSVGEAWLKLRSVQLAAGTLKISVGHRDLLILPR